MKSKRLRIALLTGICSFCFASLAVSSLAWFATYQATVIGFGGDEGEVDVSAATMALYYGGGDGLTPETAYIVSNRNHLYNLAWLQYIGTYNDPEIKQRYFKIPENTTIDMTGVTLPPIGTDKYPFLGNFDGNGSTITGLTVSNDNPTNVNSDFGLNKPTTIPSAATQPNVIGLFGVVGQLPNQEITYDSSIVEVKNVVLNDINVVAKTQRVLIGLAAGYVDGEMSGVKITGEAVLNVDNQTSQALGGQFANLTDYGLVGYTTKKGTEGTFSQKLSEFYSNGVESSGGGGGQEDDWGGSFDSKDYTTWFYDSIRDGSLSGNGTSASTPYSKTVTGAGGYSIKFTTSTSSYNPLNPPSASPYSVVYRLRDDSYLPLIFNNKATKDRAALKNTGYLVGSNVGTGVNASPKIASYPIRNIVYSYSDYASSYRIDNVARGYNDTGTSITYDSNLQDSKLEILTYSVNKVNNNNWVRIYDDYNKSHNTANSRISTYSKGSTTTSPEALGFEKYSDSRAVISENLNGKAAIHGIHFDTNAPSKDSVVTIPAGVARVGKKTYSTTYTVPKGSLNFKLSETGFINFFAGTYTTTNVSQMTFFSLFRVVRNDGASSSTITSIDRISKIYQNRYWDNTKPSNSVDNPKFFYAFTNGNTTTYSNIKVSGQIRAATTADRDTSKGNDGLVFDCANSIDGNAPALNAFYYFEIPVNDGEYAMGLSGSNNLQGAYMCYLDIGANADKIEKDGVTAHHITTKQSMRSFPSGVDFGPVAVTGNGGDTFGISIASGSKGVISFEVTSGNVEVTSPNNFAKYTYIGKKHIDSSPPSNSFTVTGNTISAMDTIATYGTRVLVINISTVGDDSYQAMITDYLTDDNGSFDSAESKYELDSGSGFQTSTEAAIDDLSTEVSVSTLRQLTVVANLQRLTGENEFVVTYDEEESDYNGKILDVDIERNGTTIGINVTANYTFRISGEQFADQSEYPVPANP